MAFQNMEVEESKVWLYKSQQRQPSVQGHRIPMTIQQVLSMHQKRMRRASSQVVEVGEEKEKRRREEGEEEESAQPGEEKRMKGEGEKTDNEEAEPVVLTCNDDSNIGNESDSDADYDDLDDLVVNR